MLSADKFHLETWEKIVGHDVPYMVCFILMECGRSMNISFCQTKVNQKCMGAFGLVKNPGLDSRKFS